MLNQQQPSPHKQRCHVIVKSLLSTRTSTTTRRSLVSVSLLVVLLGIFCFCSHTIQANSSSSKSPYFGKGITTVQKKLSEFSKLYIRYHNCAYSPYQKYHPNNNNEDQDQEDNEDACGFPIQVQQQQQGENNEGDEEVDGEAAAVYNDNNPLWYIGLSACFRSNVAYSLYGVLKSDTSDTNNHCTQHTYINSFFTTGGLESFLGTLEATGITNLVSEQYYNNNGDEAAEVDEGQEDNNVEYTSKCQRQQEEENNEGEVVEEEEFDYDSIEGLHNTKFNMDSISYGIGCTSTAASTSATNKQQSHSFVYNEYQGDYCDIRTTIQTIDTLDGLNNELINNVQCIEIYNAETYVQNDNQNNNNNNNNEGEQVENENDNENVLSPVDLLFQYSHVCDLREYPNECPDPFGSLHHQIQIHAEKNAQLQHPRTILIKLICSWFLITMGMIFLLASFYAVIAKYCQKKQKQQRYNMSNNSNTKSSDGLNNTSRTTTDTSLHDNNSQQQPTMKNNKRVGTTHGVGTGGVGMLLSSLLPNRSLSMLTPEEKRLKQFEIDEKEQIRKQKKMETILAQRTMKQQQQNERKQQKQLQQQAQLQQQQQAQAQAQQQGEDGIPVNHTTTTTTSSSPSKVNIFRQKMIQKISNLRNKK